MRDGTELAGRLEEVNSGLVSDSERLLRLGEVIDPYLQFVDESTRCEWTGLRLADIWRYFRYTWITPARSTPGRTMMILVRDAAVEPHPVIGIAALSSSIVQQKARDTWIGWHPDAIRSEIEDRPGRKIAEWLVLSLEDAVSGVYLADLLEEGIVSNNDVENPTQGAIRRLLDFASEEREKHQLHARAAAHKDRQAGQDWPELARSHLYRSKRASALATALGIRRAFIDAELVKPSVAGLVTAWRRSADFRKAVLRLVRFTKASRVGINMMDISVAGAIAPYNAILGGKLVSLLLTSPEVRRAYAQRYRNAPSVIASAMKGAPVARAPDLVLLCTTGLFAGGASQYNRVRLPAHVVGGSGGEVKFEELKGGTSYATFHISQTTMREMRIYAEQQFQGSNVHGIFGEGVNPKMRKIRESLDRLGFPSNEILQPGTPRTMYVIPLARNFRHVLLGRAKRPRYILPSGNPREATRLIAQFWRERWLSGRIQRPGVMESVRAHALTYPMRHGAVVQLPTDDEDEQLTFAESWSQLEDDVLLDNAA